VSRSEHEEEQQRLIAQDNAFLVKDSGKRMEFTSGMVRDTTEGKTEFHRAADGPMLRRWAEHLTKGATKYPDVAPGTPNWTLAAGEAERARFKQSAFRHFMQWYNDERDEDHGAAVFFNINGAEYVRGKLESQDYQKEEAIK
jgi:hypothetical protein